MHMGLKFFIAMWIGLVASTAMVSDMALAQEPSDNDGAQQQQEDAQERDDEASDEQADTDQRPDLDSQPLDTPAGQTPGRFIPSEQISLDLGVSFPVDI